MKNLKKKLATVCSLVCTAALCGGFAAMQVNVADATETVKTLKNIATDASALHVNTLAPADSVAIGDDGVTITDWNSGNDTTAGVTYKEKVTAGETVTVDFNALVANEDSGRLLFQLGPTASYNTESLWAWGSSNNPSGNILNMEFKTGWLELTKKANGTYTSEKVVTGNEGGSMFGASNFLDGTNHQLTIIKEDTATGIEITILVDGGKYVQDYAVEDTSLQGDYYFAIGMATWGTTANASDSEYCKISSINVSDVFEEQVVKLKNIATDASALHVNTLAPADSVAIGDDGVTITGWNSGNDTTAGVTYKEKVTAGETVTVDFNALVAKEDSGRLVFQLGPTASYNTESLWAWGSSNNPSGTILNMEFKKTWLELTKKANGTYTSETVVTGNGGGSMFGASDFLKGEDHQLTIIKEDTATGIEITILVDGGKYVQDYAVEDTSLQGDYYFAIGMATWGTTANASDSEYCKISSIKISNVFEDTGVRIPKFIGASIRYSEPSGLRFGAEISASDYNTVVTKFGEENVHFGMLLYPTVGLNGAELTHDTTDVEDVVCEKVQTLANGTKRIQAVLLNIPAEHNADEITARVYVAITVNGDTTYYYGDTMSDSLSSVATRLLEAGGLTTDEEAFLNKLKGGN